MVMVAAPRTPRDPRDIEYDRGGLLPVRRRNDETGTCWLWSPPIPCQRQSKLSMDHRAKPTAPLPNLPVSFIHGTLMSDVHGIHTVSTTA